MKFPFYVPVKEVLLGCLAFGLMTPQVIAQQPGHQALQIDKAQRSQRTQISDKKSFRLSYVPAPDPIPFNQHFRLNLLLQSAANKPLDGATLKVEASMPEHNHGMNVKPRVKALGQGRYEVSGLLFHMAGYWEIAVTISQGGKQEKVVFGSTLAMKPVDHSQHHH